MEGIEVFHPDHDQSAEQRAIELAEIYNLVQTGGSDYHGMYGDSETYPLGSKNAPIDSIEELEVRSNNLKSLI